MGMLRICIFLNGCCAIALPNPVDRNCGVFAGRMNEENATLVDRMGRMSLEVIMNPLHHGKVSAERTQ